MLYNIYVSLIMTYMETQADNQQADQIYPQDSRKEIVV